MKNIQEFLINESKNNFVFIGDVNEISDPNNATEVYLDPDTEYFPRHRCRHSGRSPVLRRWIPGCPESQRCVRGSVPLWWWTAAEQRRQRRKARKPKLEQEKPVFS